MIEMAIKQNKQDLSERLTKATQREIYDRLTAAHLARFEMQQEAERLNTIIAERCPAEVERLEELEKRIKDAKAEMSEMAIRLVLNGVDISQIGVDYDPKRMSVVVDQTFDFDKIVRSDDPAVVKLFQDCLKTSIKAGTLKIPTMRDAVDAKPEEERKPFLRRYATSDYTMREIKRPRAELEAQAEAKAQN